MDSIASAIAERMPTARRELTELVAIPSVFAGSLKPEVERTAAWIRDRFAELGFDVTVERTPDGSPAVIGSYPAPAGKPTVMLYAHHDVQPVDAARWASDPFVLEERDGRWYGRGAADCKGSIVAHLAALRTLKAAGGTDGFPVGIRVLIEGSEEQATAGLEEYVLDHASEFADVSSIIVMDAGNAGVGRPAIVSGLRGTAVGTVHVEALAQNVHSGIFGGAAPDAVGALVRLLATLRDENGDTTIDRLDAGGHWNGATYNEAQFRADAGMVDGTRVLGSGSIADQLWARPALTVVGIDVPSVAEGIPVIQGSAAARLNLRVPPEVDPAEAAALLEQHLLAHAPWGVTVTFSRDGMGHGFTAGNGPAVETFRGALADAYDGAPVVSLGAGGSIPLCSALERAIPGAEIILCGVCDPAAAAHGHDESVAPSEIAALATAEALFLERMGGAGQ
jgi:acetylornithine deacetylase/succinyl-diaminopimelate desuccinylase-like protein